MPFDLPDGWEWIRVSSACEINPKNCLDDNTTVSFVPMAMISDGFSNQFEFEVRKWTDVKKGFTHFAENDVGFAKITPCFENRKSVIFHNLETGFGAGTTELYILRPYSNAVTPEYLLCIVKSASFINGGKQTFSGAVGQQRISKEFVNQFFLPLPPLEEQSRIVNTMKNIIETLNSIEASLS